MIRFNNQNVTFFKKSLIFFSNLVRKIFRGDRLIRISKKLNQISREYSLKHKNKKIVILDYGCGSMEIAKKLQNSKHIKKIIGTDVFNFSFKKKKLLYLSFKNFSTIKTKIDLIIIVDVLHHIGVDKTNQILNNLSKISKNIIVKDHFEHGFFSRHLLRFVDFYANYAYDVNIPKKYFDQISWQRQIKKTKFKEKKIIKNFQQHDGLFNFILDKKHHFISILEYEN
ncbi:class I SAM-dependent methyltransferase [Candidatus Pelagibacter sp.]|nr:class I SAM-dependent methyltransferase [Candidatus Pelagibacter sp.]